MQNPALRMEDVRLPAIGSVAQAERLFRLNWIGAEWIENEQPLLSADFVSRQGRHVRILDIREEKDLLGPLGYIAGSDWVPAAQVIEALASGGVAKDDPMVIVSSSGARSYSVVKELRAHGFRFVAGMQGGVWAWRDLGFAVSHDRHIIKHRAKLRPVTFQWQTTKRDVQASDVEAHVGDPMSIRWLKLAALLVHGRASCVDGRDGTGVFGPPGGDTGEFVLLLSAYEHVTGRTLDKAAVSALLRRRIEEFGRFQLHSDVNASNMLIKALRQDPRMDQALQGVFHTTEWREFMEAPPHAVRPVLLEHMSEPAHIGCGHLRLAIQNAASYGTRPEFVQSVISSVLSARWDGAIDVEYHVLPGGHEESGVLSVFMEDGVRPFSRIPLISPSGGERQFFVAHPQVAAFLRDQQVTFLRGQKDLAPLTPGEAEQLTTEVHALGGKQLTQTLGKLASGLPLFQIRFDNAGCITVRAQGII